MPEIELLPVPPTPLARRAQSTPASPRPPSSPEALTSKRSKSVHAGYRFGARAQCP